ncbi:protein FAM117B-like isoform X2 [Bacillus rossius redtenbacheri]|uniref:protein FAM117B-like isoform X2 n=1 Tax=Bacillus rossius redtenbacheri TaxID=93214 RepID=UPI002FDECF5F
MSQPQRVRKSSPSSSKQGPMRATLPMSSLLRQSSNLKKSKSNSPTLSPTSSWKTRISPDTPSTGQRSPGSLSYKGKSRTLAMGTGQEGGGPVMRRTASLDTLYLQGQWPTESFYMYCGQLLVDKATQTEDLSNEQRRPNHRHGPDISEEKQEKLLRHRLQRPAKDGSTSCRERASAFGLILQQPLPTASQPKAASTPSKGSASRPMRSSVEALNQEIERLVLSEAERTDSKCRDAQQFGGGQPTPEGHRAPLADLLRSSTRSVNTQTPARPGELACSGPSSRESGSPPPPAAAGVSRPPSDPQGSRDSSPEQEAGKLGTSPHINKFLAREPPDGCEKVNLKFVEDTRRPMVDLSKLEYCPKKPCVTLKPSLGSAFYPLHREGPSSPVNGDLSGPSRPPP